MEALTRFAVRRPVTVVVLCLAAVLLGLLSANRLPVELLPDVEAPRVLVRLASGDRPPEEMEEEYARPIESRLATVRRVRAVSSVSRIGRTLVTVEFTWGTDMDLALLDIQKNLAFLAGAQEVDELEVVRYDPSAAPVSTLGLIPTGDDAPDMAALRRLAKDVIQPALERLPGVALARVVGGLEEEIVVRPDPYRLEAHGLNETRLLQLLYAANLDASGGTVLHRGRVYQVKGVGSFQSLDEIRSLIVGQVMQDGGREPVRLEQVADVLTAPKERRNLVRVNGSEGIGLDVFREAGANAIAVAAEVHAAVEKLDTELPGIALQVVRDPSRFVSSAVREVEEAALWGALLAIVVLWLFLRRFGPTLAVALAIPIAAVTTFVLMDFTGLTLNVMTLGGLALGAGMLVDNAIVVVENIFRHREEGEDPFEAAWRGAAEVGTAIVAATLTTCVVFIPVIFLHGIAAALFEDQALVVGYALLASLGAAFLVVPALGARVFGERPPARTLPFDKSFARIVTAFTRHRGLVSVCGIAAALLAIPLFLQVGADFLPGADAGELEVRLDLSEGSPIERTAVVAATVEQKLAELAGDDLEAIYTEVGEVEEDLWLRTEEVSSEGTAEIHAVLRSRPGRPSARDIAGALEPFLETIPEAAYGFRFGETDLEKTVGTGGEVLEIEVRGENLGELRAISETVAEMATQLGPERVLHVTTSFREGREEVRLIPDRTMLSALGMDLEGLASSVRRRLEGEEAGTFRPTAWDRKIALRYPDRPLQELLELPIDNPAGVEVRLRDLTRIERGRAPREIHRRGQSRAAVVQATLVPGADFAGTARALESGLEGIHVPTGVRLLVAGEEKERRASFRELQWALLLALVLVYMVLASLFESLIHPFTIILTVPLSAVGVALAFYFWGKPITVPALIGAVLVAGIAVNDAVILIDYATRLRRQGMERAEAVIQAARVRLRPILMTSLTTVAALLPMALGIGEGASLRSPLAVAVIGGLTASTVLTLLVVPSVYLLLDNLRPRRVREENAPAAG